MSEPERAIKRPGRFLGIALAGVVLVVWGCDGKVSLANLPNQSNEIVSDPAVADDGGSVTSAVPEPVGAGSEENSMAQWKSSGCDAPAQTYDYDGKSQEQLQELLGGPASSEEFVLAEGTTEFRIGLLNIYSLEKDGDRVIRQRTWIDGPCRLTLWLAQDGDVWSVKQGLVWPEDVEF